MRNNPFAANLDLLFTDLPLPDRFEAAARAGFAGVELLFPDAAPEDDIAMALRDTGLPLALINMPADHWPQGGRGLAAVPGSERKFRADFDHGLHLARRFGAARLHILEGLAKGPEAAATHLANLTWAAKRAGDQALTIEPINPVDIPGFFLNDFDQTAAVLAAVNAPNLGLQFDAYHAQRITGDVPGTWARHGARATHVQIAGSPARNEPDCGDFDLLGFLSLLRVDGYDGWVSAEYRPRSDTAAGLGWLKQAQAAVQKI